MKKHLTIFFAITSHAIVLQAQNPSAWERPLIICQSTNGVNFTNFQTFQDSSGVPSIISDTTGRLIAAFQWFPAPLQGAHWDSVALKYSYDSGITWTSPQALYITNFPAGYQRMFDPGLCLNADGSIRVYFSSSPTVGGLVSTYSALSADGINFTFEPGIRFTRPGQNTVDPTVIYFNGQYHYSAPKGAPQDGALHCTSIDGLNFIQQADIPSNMQHNWTGNFMIDSAALKFYGSGVSGLWFKDSPDGFVWNANYIHTGVQGGDASCIKTDFSNYIMVYTGQPNTTDISEVKYMFNFSVYPNPANESFIVKTSAIEKCLVIIADVRGKIVFQKEFVESIVLDESLDAGIYFISLQSSNTTKTQKVIVID